MSEHSPTRATLLVTGLFLGGLLSGAWTGAQAANRARDPYASLDVLARVLTLVESDYVDPVEPDALVHAAIEGVVDDLDRHSTWMTPDEYRRLRDETAGHYEGIGVEIRPDPEGVRIARVLPGSPAERDGLRAGDVLLAVGDVRLADLPFESVGDQLQGPRGTAVVLTVRRAGTPEPFEVTTVRDRIDPPAVLAERLASGIVVARLVQFPETAAGQLERAVRELSTEAPPAGLVLDLRDNPGGLLDQAVAVTDLFLDDGVIVSTRGRLEGEEVHRATPGGFSSDLRVVVLVNGMSASAAEIVTGALQDTGRATVVGTHTYGKGSVQTLYEHTDGSALKLTIGRYYTPSGEPVAPKTGRAPDHEVPWPSAPGPRAQLRERLAAIALPDDERAELLALVEALPEDAESEPEIPWHLAPSERLAADPQLAFAIDLLAQP